MGFVSVVLAALLCAGTDAPGARSDKTEAQRRLDQGAALYARGDLPGALEQFQRAYAAYPSPKLWFNIGQVQRDLGQAVDAMEAFERFLAAGSDAPSEAVDVAHAAVDELRQRLSRLHIDCPTQGARIDLDGVAVGETPLSVDRWLWPGKHVVSAMGNAAATTTTEIDLRPGEGQTVVLQWNAQAPPALGSTEGEDRTSPTRVPSLTSHPRPRGWLGRKWTWVAGGLAVASAAGAITFGVLMQAKYDQLDKSCGSASATRPGCSPSDIHTLDLRKDTANVLWGVAGAAALTAGVLWFVEGRRVQVAPMAGSGTVGMAAAASF